MATVVPCETVLGNGEEPPGVTCVRESERWLDTRELAHAFQARDACTLIALNECEPECCWEPDELHRHVAKALGVAVVDLAGVSPPASGRPAGVMPLAQYLRWRIIDTARAGVWSQAPGLDFSEERLGSLLRSDLIPWALAKEASSTVQGPEV